LSATPPAKNRPERIKRLQHEATRAWNIHTALYYKAGGTPWRLLRAPSEYATCYVGVSFYRTLDGSRLHTSITQVFNERGDGVVVRGAEIRLTKDDPQPHLDEPAAYQLLYDALDAIAMSTATCLLVLSCIKKHNEAEIAGFVRAAHEQRIGYVDLVSLHDSFTRLLRTREYAPLRGTLLHLDAYEHVLYTKGSVDFFATTLVCTFRVRSVLAVIALNTRRRCLARRFSG
jgi:hypothetical protein